MLWCPRCRLTDERWRMVRVLKDGRRIAADVGEYKHACGWFVYAEPEAVAV